MRKAKIICTLGPASQTPSAIGGLIRAGMDVARLNFSHGTRREHQQRLELVRTLARKLDRPVAVLQDIQGPKLRVGKFVGGQSALRSGDRVLLTTRNVLGSGRTVPTPNPWLPRDVKPGEAILIDDGKIRLRVAAVRGRDVRCTGVVGGIIKDKKGIKLPAPRPALPP